MVLKQQRALQRMHVIVLGPKTLFSSPSKPTAKLLHASLGRFSSLMTSGQLSKLNRAAVLVNCKQLNCIEQSSFITSNMQKLQADLISTVKIKVGQERKLIVHY